MKKLFLLFMMALVVAGWEASTLAQGKPSAAGQWEGAINIQGMELAIKVRLRQDEKGQWTGTIDVPAQGVSNFSLARVVVEDAVVSFAMAGIPGEPSFKGELSSEGRVIQGELTQGGQAFQFRLERKTDEKPAPGQAAPAQAAGASIEGNWEGALQVEATRLRLVVKISKRADGSLTGAVDSLDQSAMNLRITAATQKDDAVRLELKSIGAVYEARLNKGGDEMSGQWNQAGSPLPLTLKRVGKPTALNRPQEPKKPYPYDEEEVVYDNLKAGIKIAGTLTLPRSKGPFPAVLLITGSGPQDRNESLLGHKPFLVLADHLTRRGIAVLRVDDRGVGKSTGNFAGATSEDFAEDAVAGVEYLKGRPQINAKQIGLIGHSEGGVVAPMAALKSPDVAFIVLMAGTGITGEEISFMQSALISKASGVDDRSIARNRALLESLFAVVKQEKESAAVEKGIREAVDKWKAGLTEDEKKALALTLTSLDHQLRLIKSPWFRYFLTYDPRATLMKLKIPVLAINGEKDLQVPPKENLQAIEQALKAGGNKRYKVVNLPGLNHLFQTSTTGSPSEYLGIEETIAPVALEMISGWILNDALKR